MRSCFVTPAVVGLCRQHGGHSATISKDVMSMRIEENDGIFNRQHLCLNTQASAMLNPIEYGSVLSCRVVEAKPDNNHGGTTPLQLRRVC